MVQASFHRIYRISFSAKCEYYVDCQGFGIKFSQFTFVYSSTEILFGMNYIY